MSGPIATEFLMNSRSVSVLASAAECTSGSETTSMPYRMVELQDTGESALPCAGGGVSAWHPDWPHEANRTWHWCRCHPAGTMRT